MNIRNGTYEIEFHERFKGYLFATRQESSEVVRALQYFDEKAGQLDFVSHNETIVIVPNNEIVIGTGKELLYESPKDSISYKLPDVKNYSTRYIEIFSTKGVGLLHEPTLIYVGRPYIKDGRFFYRK